MSPIAPTVQSFFGERLAKQRQASPATITAYRNTFRLLLRFTHDRSGKAPSALDWDDLGPEVISAFLDHLEADRDNSARTRNARLAAVRSLYRYAALRHPEHAELIGQVLAIPPKRFDMAIVSFLEPDEVDALLAAPDQGRWEGRRDRALLVLAVQTGLRLSELTGITRGDVELGTGAHVRCRGKGRKQRCVPLTPTTVTILRIWLRERAGLRDDPVFPTRTGRRLSDDAVEKLLAKHKAVAGRRCHSLALSRPPRRSAHPHPAADPRSAGPAPARSDPRPSGAARRTGSTRETTPPQPPRRPPACPPPSVARSARPAR